MNSVTKNLLGGCALCALAASSASAADAPAFHIAALNDGQVVNKTRLRNPCCGGRTYTFAVSISTYVPASDLDTEVILPSTIVTFVGSKCTPPKLKIRIPKRSKYAKLGIVAVSSSGQCSVGDTYELTKPAGEGQADSFVSSLIMKFQKGGVKYKEILQLDVSVAIGE